MNRIYIGIDNGVTGALAAVVDAGALYDHMPMPVQRSRKGNEIDVVAVDDWITYVNSYDKSACLTFIVEEPAGHRNARTAMSMAGSFHAIRAMLEVTGRRWHRITPQSWQKVMIPGAKGDTKQRALAKARQLWPHKTFLATAKSRVPSDGAVDAALMAEYGRLQQL